MKIFVILAALVSAVCASGLYGHHIPARIDIAPGGVETVLTHKTILEPVVTQYKTPITAPVIQRIPIIGKTLHTSVEHIPLAHGYGHGYGKALY